MRKLIGSYLTSENLKALGMLILLCGMFFQYWGEYIKFKVWLIRPYVVTTCSISR